MVKAAMRQDLRAVEEPVYDESLSSRQTALLFQSLSILFFALLAHRIMSSGMNALAGIYAFFLLFFLFYSINYRVLHIHITCQDLTLRFGIVTWRVDLNNAVNCALDQLPKFLEYGGAGVHFMTVHGRYRVSFNFLEYPRVVVALKCPRGPVRDVSFSTRHPDEVIRVLQQLTPAIGNPPSE